MTAYAHIIDGTIEAVRDHLPKGADANGQWLTLTDANAHLAGWLPVTDTARPSDTTQATFHRSVELVNGTPTVVWTAVQLTPDEVLGIPLDRAGVIATLNVVLGLWNIQDAANAAGVSPAALIAEAEAWAAAD